MCDPSPGVVSAGATTGKVQVGRGNSAEAEQSTDGGIVSDGAGAGEVQVGRGSSVETE